MRRLTIPRDFRDEFIDMLDRCRVSYVVEEETYEREPYSWGQSRSSNIAVGARIEVVEVGSKLLTREDMIAMFGKEQIRDVEAREAERRAEDLTYA